MDSRLLNEFLEHCGEKSGKMGDVQTSVQNTVIANFTVIKYSNFMVVKEDINYQKFFLKA
jgi:hypothetical protein